MRNTLRVHQPDAPLKRRLAAVAFLDVVGYSRLMGSNDEATLREWLAMQSAVIEPRVMAWRGRVVNRAGDGIFVEFYSVLEAFRWAMDVQDAAVCRVPTGSQMQVRIALHLGDVIDGPDGEVQGDGVNTAARLQTYAKPGGIIVSQAVANELSGKTTALFLDLGMLNLRNIVRPVRAFRVHAIETPPNFRRGHWFGGKDQAQTVKPALAPSTANWRFVLTKAYVLGHTLARLAKWPSVWGACACGTIALSGLLIWPLPHSVAPQARPSLAAIVQSGSLSTPRDEAKRLFNQGRNIVCSSYPCPREWLAARALFEKAIAADPDYAPAYAAATFTYTNFVASDLSLNKNEDLRVAEGLATRAAALAPEQAISHEARAAVLRQNPDRLEEALAAYLRSLAINPNNSSVRANAGWMLVLLGRPLEAEPYLRAAISADPNHSRAPAWLTYLGFAELFANQKGHGADSFRQALALQPPTAANADIGLRRSIDLASALALSGAIGEAKSIVDGLRKQYPALSTDTLLNCDCSKKPGFLAGYRALKRGAVLAGVAETE